MIETTLVLALVAGLILYAMILGASRKPGRRKSSVSYLDRSAVTLRWQAIMATAETGPAGLKAAISEADKLFDHVMRQQDFRGTTMAERLKQAQVRLSDRNGVWHAHKLRNELAHNVTFDLVPSQARGALADFERGLRDLGAL